VTATSPTGSGQGWAHAALHGGTPERQGAARRLRIPLERPEGRVLDLTTLDAHENCRGSAPVAIGHETARGHVIDARIIGEAARSGRYEPPPLTQLWHLAARWGRPRS